jgi:hypothetical protein
MQNYYFNQEKSLLVLTDENYKPVKAFAGNIARKKFKEITVKPSFQDLQKELELCKSVLLNSPEDLPADIRADYQRRYRQLKKAVETAQTELLTKN